MADRPILFSGPMVRALLDGCKTQTRRVFKPHGFNFYTHPVSGDRYEEHNREGITGCGPMRAFGYGEGLYGYLPYAPGDRLYVRETWAYWPLVGEHDRIDGCTYRATDEDDWENRMFDWIPSIHMPRWASRLTLIVTDVRVERLQDISAADAMAEGVVWREPTEADFEWAKSYAEECGSPVDMEGVWTVPGAKGPANGDVWGCTPEQSYRFLWDSINGAGAWDKNPWVVAVSFEVIRGNIDILGGN